MEESVELEVFDGMMDLENKSITGRMEIVYDALDMAERRLEEIDNAIEQYRDDGNFSALRRKAHRLTEDLMRRIELVKTEFPDTIRTTRYGRLHSESHHLYWRLEDEWWEDERGSQSIINELNDILEERNAVEDMRNSLTQKLERIYFRPPVDDFIEEFNQAKDLLSLEHYDTAIFVMCRACEQAQWVLGKERNIDSVEMRGDTYAWDSEDIPAWARNEALYNIDFPDESGKMIERSTRERFERVYTELRNDVAHLSQKEYDKERGVREFKNLKELLMTLSQRISDIRSYDGDIQAISVKVNPPN